MSDKCESAILAKIAHVSEQIGALTAKERIVARVGGLDVSNMGDEVAFQQSRLDVLGWCLIHDAAEIAIRRAALHTLMGPELVALKGESMRGLPNEMVSQVAEAELLDLSLGEL
jgi:hypothetical protein